MNSDNTFVESGYKKPFVVSLMELLAIRLSGTAAKSLVMSNHVRPFDRLRANGFL